MTKEARSRWKMSQKAYLCIWGSTITLPSPHQDVFTICILNSDCKKIPIINRSQHLLIIDATVTNKQSELYWRKFESTEWRKEKGNKTQIVKKNHSRASRPKATLSWTEEAVPSHQIQPKKVHSEMLINCPKAFRFQNQNILFPFLLYLDSSREHTKVSHVKYITNLKKPGS